MRKILFAVTLISLLSCTKEDNIELTKCDILKNKLDSVQNLYKKGFPVQGFDNPQYIPMRKIQNEYKDNQCELTNTIIY